MPRWCVRFDPLPAATVLPFFPIVAKRKSSPQPLELPLLFAGPPPKLTGGEPSPPVAAAPAKLAKAAEAEPAPEVAAVKILTVTQLTRRVRALLERQLGFVWVEGELSNVRRQSSGHTYFTLKDEGAQLACVLFRGSARPDMPELADGLKVQAGGVLTVYEPRGQYQLVVEELQAAGLGRLQAQFEALKRRLAAEGLFDAARKRALPAFPRCVALVTSASGAALRDMLRGLDQRASWVRVLICPVKVQGEGAAAEITAALRWLGGLATTPAALEGPLPEVVIVGRGGGSIEDLWAFNEESVARAIAACPVPVVSAVGHEIDFTIADFAADVRAPTPTAAAQLVVPDGAALRRRLDELARALAIRVQTAVAHARSLVDLLSRRGLAREPLRHLAQRRQQVDEWSAALAALTGRELERAYERWQRAFQRLEARQPSALLEQQRQRRLWLEGRLHAVMRRHLDATAERLRRLGDLLRTLGPQGVLARGFSCTLGPEGKPLRRAADVRPGDRLRTRLADGVITSVVEAPSRSPKSSHAGQ